MLSYDGNICIKWFPGMKIHIKFITHTKFKVSECKTKKVLYSWIKLVITVFLISVSPSVVKRKPSKAVKNRHFLLKMYIHVTKKRLSPDKPAWRVIYNGELLEVSPRKRQAAVWWVEEVWGGWSLRRKEAGPWSVSSWWQHEHETCAHMSVLN